MDDGRILEGGGRGFDAPSADGDRQRCPRVVWLCTSPAEHRPSDGPEAFYNSSGKPRHAHTRRQQPPRRGRFSATEKAPTAQTKATAQTKEPPPAGLSCERQRLQPRALLDHATLETMRSALVTVGVIFIQAMARCSHQEARRSVENDGFCSSLTRR